ncbi:uncharacterized protein LOC117909043 [Vitis riparia]|uniref:uncharacterized protein LOC117909043 n=1 Tax=Vitis riparia TaxID=96939 RepID=UPI00155B07E0|nr:uncharacterized protein LOC117909043 [Vitis riparia]
MATLSSISPIFILVLVFSTPTFEARKMLRLKKGEVSSMEESLELASFLPKVPKPASSSSSDDEGHARVVSINGRFFTLHLPSINDHRIREEAIPSPGVGHHRILEESIPSPGVGHQRILEESIPSPGVGHHRILEESVPSPGVGHHTH